MRKFKTVKQTLTLMSRKTKLKCAGIILLTVVSSLLASYCPGMIADICSGISEGTFDSLASGIFAVLTVGLIFLSAELVGYIRRVLMDCVITTHEAEVKEKGIGKLLKMPVSKLTGSMSGEITSRLDQGIGGLSQIIKLVCNDVFTTVLTAAFTLIQVFIHASLMMVGIMLAYLAVTITISVFQIKSQNGVREKIRDKRDECHGQFCQSLLNIELIRCLNAVRYELKRLIPGIRDIRDAENKHHRYMGKFDLIKQVCKILFQFTLLAASVVMVFEGNMSGAAALAVYLLFQQLVKPVEDVYRFMDEAASSVVKAQRLFEITSGEDDKVFGIVSGGEQPKDSRVVLEDIVITDPSGEEQLAWYDRVDIPADSIVALKGPNGCGKSSLAKCLNRYYPHSSGSIKLFGCDQASFDQQELTDIVYYSPQSSYFFKGTVRENLIYGLGREASDDELIRALYSVHLVGTDHSDTVIAADGKKALDACLSEKSEQLSGGMKQRLSLARAFLRSPKLFIFDEITANLDGRQRDLVLGNIESYAQEIGAGVIYISHDQCVVSRCRQVIELDNKLRRSSDETRAA